MGSRLVTGVLVEIAELDARLYAFNLSDIGAALKDRIYGVDPSGAFDGGESSPGDRISELSTMFVLAANAAWVLAGTGRGLVALPAKSRAVNEVPSSPGACARSRCGRWRGGPPATSGGTCGHAIAYRHGRGAWRVEDLGDVVACQT